MESSEGVKKQNKDYLFDTLTQYLEIRPDIYDLKLSEDKSLGDIMS